MALFIPKTLCRLCSNCNGPDASSANGLAEGKGDLTSKHISFPDSRQLLRAKMPSVVYGGKSYAAAASTRKEMKTAEFQTSVTCCFCRSVRSRQLHLQYVPLAGPDNADVGFSCAFLGRHSGSRGRNWPTPGFRAIPRRVQRQLRVQPISPKGILKR